MLVSSLFSWSFLGSSLVLCVALLNQYAKFWDLTIREVFGGSLLASITFATVMTFIARKHASTETLERMRGSAGLKSIGTGFTLLASRMGIQGVSLREATLGSAFSISLDGHGVAAVSPELVASLTPDEAEAVVAHELSHIKNGDSTAKGLARLARAAFPFDPVLRLVEAAVHRERELWADRVSVEFTGKPPALASAIVKANSESNVGTTSNLAGLFVGGSGHGLLSLYPNLERRVDILLELARRMEIANSPLVAA